MRRNLFDEGKRQSQAASRERKDSLIVLLGLFKLAFVQALPLA